jgi:excisionase family DNA binding protein
MNSGQAPTSTPWGSNGGPRLLGVKQVAERLSISQDSVRRLVKAGTLRQVRVEGLDRLLVDAASLTRLVQGAA